MIKDYFLFHVGMASGNRRSGVAGNKRRIGLARRSGSLDVQRRRLLKCCSNCIICVGTQRFVIRVNNANDFRVRSENALNVDRSWDSDDRVVTSPTRPGSEAQLNKVKCVVTANDLLNCWGFASRERLRK